MKNGIQGNGHPATEIWELKDGEFHFLAPLLSFFSKMGPGPGRNKHRHIQGILN
jgi:hypothetical protein